MLHNYTQCYNKSKVRSNVQRHMRTQHKSYSNNKIPVIVDQTLPTQVGYGALTPCVQTESNNNNNTVTTEDYEKVVDIANGWKRECEKVQQDWKMLDYEIYDRNIRLEKLENINKNIQGENKNLRMNNANMHGEIQNLRMNNAKFLMMVIRILQKWESIWEI